MAHRRDDIIDIDLDEGIQRSFFNHVLSEGDISAIRFGVRVKKSGVAVDLAGAKPMGYFIRANNTTVTITGNTITSGNVAWITLPASCFTQEGNFSLALKLVGGGVTGTMRIIDGTVVNTWTNPITDPGHVIPDLTELMNIIAQAEAAANTISNFGVSAQLISGDNYRIVITQPS